MVMDENYEVFLTISCCVALVHSGTAMLWYRWIWCQYLGMVSVLCSGRDLESQIVMENSRFLNQYKVFTRYR